RDRDQSCNHPASNRGWLARTLRLPRSSSTRTPRHVAFQVRWLEVRQAREQTLPAPASPAVSLFAPTGRTDHSWYTPANEISKRPIIRDPSRALRRRRTIDLDSSRR